MLALLLLLAAEPTCKATTNIPELLEGLQRTCRPEYKSLSLTGTHDEAIYEIRYAEDWTGKFVGFTPKATELLNRAIAIHDIIQNFIFPAEELVIKLRDGKAQPICAFRFLADAEEPEDKFCTPVVGESPES